MKKKNFFRRYTLFIVLSMFAIGNTAAQEPGTEEVYTLADTAQARQMMDEVKVLVKKSQWNDASIKAQNAKRIYTSVFGSAGNLGVSKAWYGIGYVLFKQNKIEESLNARLESLRVMKLI